jgi:plastocyanin
MVKGRWVRLVAGLFALSLVVAACGGDDDGDDTTGATGATEETGGGGGGTSITIADFAFDPDTITVSGPTDVTITNDDSAPHTFTADDDSFDVQIDPGATETVTVDVSQTTGFHCAIHPDMTGTVEVA